MEPQDPESSTPARSTQPSNRPSTEMPNADKKNAKNNCITSSALHANGYSFS